MAETEAKIVMRVTPEERDGLKAMARAYGTNVSDYIRSRLGLTRTQPGVPIGRKPEAKEKAR